MLITIKISEVLHALANGQTWTKKDDLGFGSLEKDYKLTPKDIAQLKAHPKLNGVETTIPSIMIIDDTNDIPNIQPKSTENETPSFQESKIEVRPKEIRVKIEEEEPIYQTFI